MKIHLREYDSRLYRKIWRAKVNFYKIVRVKHSPKFMRRARYWARVESKWCKRVDWSKVKNDLK